MGVSSTRIGPSNRLTGKSGGWTPALLSPALWLDAASLTSGSTTWPNLGTGGSALNGTFGASAAAPRVLPHTGTNYLYLPGVANNGASTPNRVAFIPASSLQIDWDFMPLDLSVAEQSLVTVFGAAGNRGWRLSLGASAFALVWSTDGGDVNVGSQSVSFATMGVSVGVRSRGRAILRFNNGGGNYDVRWYTVDAVGAATLVETDTGVGTTSIFASTQALEVGTRTGLGVPINANIYGCKVTVDGTAVFDADFTTGITSGGQTGIFDSSSNNAAVTINRSSSGYKATAVVRPTLLFGGGQYVEVADNALINFDASTSMSLLVFMRQWNTPNLSARVVSKANSGNIVGWQLTNSAATLTPLAGIGDGTTTPTSIAGTTPAAGAMSCLGMQVDRSSQNLYAITNTSVSAGVSTATVGTLVNTYPMRVGTIGQFLSNYIDMECVGVLLFRRTLTAAEITQIADYYTYEGALSYTVGTLATANGFNTLTFTGSGTFTPGRNLPVEYLVVAGGGGGGGGTSANYYGGGGGAGGLLTNVGATEIVLPKSQATITIGAGGAGGSAGGTTGSNSSIGAFVVANGGGGGGALGVDGGTGGSGGGGGRQRLGGAAIAGQGNAGGSSTLSSYASGGGGASSAGANGSANIGGAGGAGLASSISGTSTVYAGGGGGSGLSTQGAGGSGGGAAGAVDIAGNAGTVNTGGGGGGTGSTTVATNVGGAGGSGIVIIRWPA